MAYGWTEHVGELELWIEAETREEVFAEAVRAFAELAAADEAVVGPVRRRAVELDGQDRAVLLADWIGELAFLAETEGFVPEAAENVILAPSGLRARLRGRRGAPPHLVKAVTYHRLAFEPHGDGWRAVAVLDV